MLLALVAAVEVALVGYVRLPAMIDPDSAQLLSAAKNLLSGHGLSTSALYYEEQFALGPPPVPLTVWPPGLSLFAMPFVALGISASTTAFIVAAIGHVATILLSYWICLLAGLRRAVALGVGAAVAGLGFAFTLVASGYSEPAFTAATLASAGLLLMARGSERPLRLLVAASVFTTIAISFRYAGLAWLAASLAVITVLNLRSGTRRLLLGWAALGVLPVAFCAALFARNLADVGTLTGGPLLGGDSNLLEIARNSYWAVLRVFGATGSAFGTVVLVVFLASLVSWLVWTAVRRLATAIRAPANSSAPSPGERMVLCALAYAGATGALLLYLSITAYPGFVKERYLMPVIPFALIAAGLFLAQLQDHTRRMGGVGAAAFIGTVLFLFVAFTSGQYRVLKRQNEVMKSIQVLVADAVYHARVGGEPLMDFLSRTVSMEHPLITDRGQVLSAILDRPTLELPLPEYSRLTYDEPTVRDLMRRMNSCLLLVHPETTAGATGDRRVLLRQLASGYRPEWMNELMDDSGLLLFQARWCVA